MNETFAAKVQSIGKLRRTGDERCQVLGIDWTSGEDWIIKSVDSPIEAIRLARLMSRGSMNTADDRSVATVYYAYDSEGNYIGGDVWEDVTPPFQATAVVVDLRNFTPSLNRAKIDSHGVNLFCRFLSDFYDLCLDSCVISLPKSARAKQPFYSSSTGDGMVLVFAGENHVLHGFLATLVLHNVLSARCNRWNDALLDSDMPKTGVGIGIESGAVSRIRALFPSDNTSSFIDTCIGNCINIAARIEALTKSYGSVRTIVGKSTNELLCSTLFNASYGDLVKSTRSETLNDATKFKLHDSLTNLNRKLCISFIHRHSLKGVDDPLPLFRLSGSRARLGNTHFEELIASLAENIDHVVEIHDFIKYSVNQSGISCND